MGKRILVIGHSFILAQNRDVFRHLHNQGRWDITVLAPRFFHGDLRDIHIEGEPANSNLRVLPIDCYGTRYIHFFAYNVFQVERLLKREKFDAVYLWEEAYVVAGFTLAHFFHKHKIPYFIYSCQNIFKKYPWPFSFLENKVHHHARTLLGCGYGVREVFLQKGYSSEVVPFFASLDRFKPRSKQSKMEMIQSLGLEESITVGFMGRLVEEKGLTLFMKVMDKVLFCRKCNIIVIGSGEMEDALGAWAQKHKNVRVMALKHDEVPKVLSAFDLILCPSQTRPHWKEQFGRMLLEAFASGVTVVGSDSGEIPHVIGDAGVVLKENDVDQWRDVVVELIDDEAKRSQLAQRGLARAQVYSVDAVAEKLYASMEKALEKT